jgi:3-oxoacyl-[acyl-carrier protein] reductase
MENLEKVLLITGASSDIGLALIQSLHQQYDKIIAHYFQNAEGLTAIKEKIGEKLVLEQADFQDAASTQSFANRAAQGEQPPTHFVHLPALPLKNIRFSRTDWPVFEGELNTAYRSAVLLCQNILPLMAARKYGKIVFMLSHNVLNQPPIRYAVPYTSVKYALLGLMKGLSAEYSGKGITVNGVSPSMTETRFLREVPELIIQKNAQESPIGRNLTVYDVIPAFEFLLSDKADCITGQNIGVTAGN